MSFSKLSYSLGLLIGQEVINKNIGEIIKLNEISPKNIGDGIIDYVNKVEKTKVKTEDVNNILRDAMTAVEVQKQINYLNFFNNKKKEDGVVETESGLMYKILREGDGPKPKSNKSFVTVHYEGRLVDDTVFDSSYRRNVPSTFQLDKVIKGWTEGLQYMNVGSKFEFYIPSNLGYGNTAVASIPANSTLIFVVELLETKE